MAFELGKKVFLYNPTPDTSMKDELLAMVTLVINGDLNLVQ